MDKQRSFVKVYRDWLFNPIIWTDSDHIAVWMYLLREANFAEGEGHFKGKPITLKPGQLITGRKHISACTGCNESKIYRVLKKFENAQLIEQQTSNKNSLITVLNWNECKGGEQQNVTVVKRDWNESETQSNTLLKNIDIDTEKDIDYYGGQAPTPDIKTFGGATAIVMKKLCTVPEYNEDLADAVVEWLKHLKSIGYLENGVSVLLGMIDDEDSSLHHEGAGKTVDAIHNSISRNSINICWDISSKTIDNCPFN